MCANNVFSGCLSTDGRACVCRLNKGLSVSTENSSLGVLITFLFSCEHAVEIYKNVSTNMWQLKLTVKHFVFSASCLDAFKIYNLLNMMLIILCGNKAPVRNKFPLFHSAIRRKTLELSLALRLRKCVQRSISVTQITMLLFCSVSVQTLLWPFT